MILDVSKWRMRDMWREPDGDLCVRPGVRILAEINETIVGGFSVKNESTGEVWHYIATDEGADGIHLHIYEEDFTEFQDFTWSVTTVEVSAVTHAIVQGQMVICCPELPTLYGLVGSGVGLAEAVASDNPSATALTEVPRGIVVAICNRAVIANGRTLYVSDPIGLDGGDLRTFVGVNVNQRPGIIYGVHEGAHGALVCVTSVGTFALDVDAFAVQVVGMNGSAWRLLSHTGALSFESSCVHRGRVWVVVQDGIALCDVETTEEIALADPTMPRQYGPQITGDFRGGRLFAMNEGPVLALEDFNALWRSDLNAEHFSWWTTLGTMRGVLSRADGGDLILLGDNVWEFTGDFDAGSSIEDADDEDQPRGVILGVVPATALDNMLPRQVQFAAAVDGAVRISIAVRGSVHTADAMPADAFGVVDNEEPGEDNRWSPVPVQTAEIDFGDAEDTEATRDVGLELAAQGCLVRVNPRVSLEVTESAARRPRVKG